MTGRMIRPRAARCRQRGSMLAGVALTTLLTFPAGASGERIDYDELERLNRDEASEGGRGAITLRPAAVAALIGEVAGHRVRIPDARIVWVIDSRALVIESDTRLAPAPGREDRVLVVLERGSLMIPRPPIDTAPIAVWGVARTLLGVQAGDGQAWPAALTRELIDRLEIRAAVVASSVQTAEGVELTSGKGAF